MTWHFDEAEARWRTSSHSGGGNQCVEVAGNLPDRVLVRDSKNREGGIHVVGTSAWRTFVTGVKHDRL